MDYYITLIQKQLLIHKHHVLQCFTQKKHVLAGPVQALFAACRIALSLVAASTGHQDEDARPRDSLPVAAGKWKRGVASSPRPSPAKVVGDEMLSVDMC